MAKYIVHFVHSVHSTALILNMADERDYAAI